MRYVHAQDVLATWWLHAPEGADKDGQICHVGRTGMAALRYVHAQVCGHVADGHGAMADSSILWEVMAWPKARHP